MFFHKSVKAYDCIESHYAVYLQQLQKQVNSHVPKVQKRHSSLLRIDSDNPRDIMKNFKKRLASKISFSLLIMFFSMGIALPPESYQFNVPKFSDSINRFTFDLLKDNAKNSRTNGILSGQNIYTGIAMSYIGSKGETKTELQKMFHYPNNVQNLATELNKMSSEYAEAAKSPKVTVHSANSLWIDKTYASFKQSYLDLTKDAFDAELHAVKYRNKNSVAGKINQWVSEKTNGKINSVVSPEDFESKSSRFIINEPALTTINAIYFKAEWASQFDESQTTPKDFHLSSIETVKAPMMQQQSTFNYAENSNFQFISLPYINHQFSMLILLPKQNIPAQQALKRTDLNGLYWFIKNSRTYDVNLMLPKFTTRNKLDIKHFLTSKGVKKAFDENRADFGNMISPNVQAQRAYLNKISHDAFVEVNEKGTEAAAATTSIHFSIGCSATPALSYPYVKFHADHPFIYFIVHNKSNRILFSGWINEPTGTP